MEIDASTATFELAPGDASAALEAGALVVDGRPPEAYDACHVPGSLNVPLAGGFPERIRAVLRPHTDIIVAAASHGDAAAMAWAIEREGRGLVRGILAGGLEAYTAAGFEVARLYALAAERIADDLELGGAVLLDAREDEDWVRGHVPGSLHVPLRSVATAAPLLPAAAPVVVACADGSRAATAASILRRFGHANVWRIAGAGVPYLLSRRLDLGGI